MQQRKNYIYIKKCSKNMNSKFAAIHMHKMWRKEKKRNFVDMQKINKDKKKLRCLFFMQENS